MNDDELLDFLTDPQAGAAALAAGRRPRVAVVCTGKGHHGRMVIDTLEVTDDGEVVEVLARGAAFRGGVTEDGATIANRAVVPARSCRDDFEGRVRWRFTCPAPACRVDRPMTHDNLTREVLKQVGEGAPILDVSLLSR